jgi:hypothetical protein
MPENQQEGKVEHTFNSYGKKIPEEGIKGLIII